MARRYGNFTPQRRAALRKAQLASAAKRRGRRRVVRQLSPRTKKVLKYAAVGAAAYGTYRAISVPVYHNTSPKSANGIMATGFKGAKRGTTGQAAYFSIGRNRTKEFGTATVKGRISRRQLHKVAHIDPEYQHKGYRYIHAQDLHVVRGLHVSRKREASIYAGKKVRNGHRIVSRKIKQPTARRRLRKAGIY
jgi:hypothetical protein